MKINAGFDSFNSYTVFDSGKNRVAEPLTIPDAVLPSKETAGPEKAALQNAYEPLKAKLESAENTLKTPDTASRTTRAIELISEKIRYLEKMQESIENKVTIQGDGLASEGITSIINARHFSIRVNMMILEYRRYAIMAQANAEPQRVLSLIGK